MDEEVFKKQVGVKIKQLRTIKGWSRQQIADRLEMSVTGYGGIERGETDVCITRLARIATVFEIALSDLLGWNEKITFNLSQDNNQDCDNLQAWQFGSPSQETKDLILKNELEKCRLLQQAQQTEIKQLKKIITLLEKSAVV